MLSKVRYLLLQVRNDDDPMSHHEVECFAKALHCDESQIAVFDLLKGAPGKREFDASDICLVGGSGDYSATAEADWMARTCDALREIHDTRKPMFGSCWGFQALAKALGGEVIHDLEHAELGTIEITLTEAGKADPVFGPVGATFIAPIGHEDCVTRIPEHCTLLGQTDKANQIYRFDDAPIYATQFHPELDQEGLIRRLEIYPKYVEKITHYKFEEFIKTLKETPKMDGILRRFVQHML